MSNFPCKIIEADLDSNIVTLQMEGAYTVSAGQKYLCNAAPVAAQPDLTQQTLDDVKAGIPARDAEIAALRKEIEALQAAQAQQPVSGADGLPIELRGIAEAIGNGGGFWRSCSGCHESNEGMATGPFSETLKCHLGVGCSECGGIGAIWDTTDYDAMADFMAAEYQQRTENTEPVGQGQLRDAAQMIEPSGNSGDLGAHNLNTSAGGRGYVAEYFSKRVGRHDFTRYINESLAADFACALAQHLSQQDAGKVKAGLLSSLVKIVDAVIASDEEGLIEHSETIIEARAAIDAARKEPDQ